MGHDGTASLPLALRLYCPPEAGFCWVCVRGWDLDTVRFENVMVLVITSILGAVGHKVLAVGKLDTQADGRRSLIRLRRGRMGVEQ